MHTFPHSVSIEVDIPFDKFIGATDPLLGLSKQYLNSELELCRLFGAKTASLKLFIIFFTIVSSSLVSFVVLWSFNLTMNKFPRIRLPCNGRRALL